MRSPVSRFWQTDRHATTLSRRKGGFGIICSNLLYTFVISPQIRHPDKEKNHCKDLSILKLPHCGEGSDDTCSLPSEFMFEMLPHLVVELTVETITSNPKRYFAPVVIFFSQVRAIVIVYRAYNLNAAKHSMALPIPLPSPSSPAGMALFSLQTNGFGHLTVVY